MTATTPSASNQITVSAPRVDLPQLRGGGVALWHGARRMLRSAASLLTIEQTPSGQALTGMERLASSPR